MDRRHLLSSLRAVLLVGLLLLFAVSLVTALLQDHRRVPLGEAGGTDPGIRILLHDADGDREWPTITLSPLQECTLYSPMDKSLGQLVVTPPHRLRLTAQGRDGIAISIPSQQIDVIWPVEKVNLTSQRIQVDGPIDDLARVETFSRQPVFEILDTGRRYRGQLEVTLDWATGLYPVNALPIEVWLEGVLQSELPVSWPQEVYHAQAVAARSYAYAAAYRSRLQRGDGVLFDLTDGGIDPAYQGTGSGHRKIDSAIDHTRGMILTYYDRPFHAHVHAASGGWTAAITDITRDARTADGQRSLESVMPAHEDPYYQLGLALVDEPDRYAEREVEIEVADLRRLLREAGESGASFYQITAVRGEGDRVEQVVLHRDGGEFRLSAHRFRMLVGPDLVRSTLWSEDSPRLELGVIRLTTIGRGHGVGMSQISARAMADAGHGFRDILNFFYRDSDLGRRW